MSDFDPKRQLVMASFRTVLGHNLNRGARLSIVEKPEAAGEVDLAMAQRLHGGGIAVYAEDFRPTPVETPDQAAARQAAVNLREVEQAEQAAASGEGRVKVPELQVTEDLMVWQQDDEETGKKAGQKVTKEDLIVIAGREEVVVEGDDNKPDLQRKIMEVRAARLANEPPAGVE